MCLKEIGLHVQNVMIILGLVVNIIEENLYDHFTSTRIFTLMLSKIFIRAPKILRKTTMTWIWIYEPSHTTHVFHILGEVGLCLKLV